MTVFRRYELVDAFNDILQLRDEDDYVCVPFATSSGTIHKVVSEDLLGNLGNFRFLSGTDVLGCGIIASSAKTKNELEDYYKRQGISAIVVKALACGRVWYYDPQLPENNNLVVLDVEYPARKNHDSEYILLNLIHHDLKVRGIDSGLLQLISERIPCASCTDVIARFKADHPNIEVEIYYFMDTVGEKKKQKVIRTSREVLHQLAGTRVRLFQCVEQGGIVDAFSRS
jgi:chorismate mutase